MSRVVNPHEIGAIGFKAHRVPGRVRFCKANGTKGGGIDMVTLQDAKRITAAAEKKAQELGQPMNIAVADAGGNLVSHVRMDGASARALPGS